MDKRRYDVEKINAIPIDEVCANLGIEVKRRGSTLMARCVEHEDSNPSMHVMAKGEGENFCFCFVCKKRWNVIGLVMSYRKCGFVDACRWVEQQFPYKVESGEWKVENGKCSRRKKYQPAVKPGVKMQMMKEEDFTTLRMDYVLRSMSMKSSFARCMVERFGIERAVDVVSKYRLGALDAWNRYPDVMFPSIDIHNRVRDIKVQSYECDNRSDRFFHRGNTCYWLGKTLYPDAVFNRNCLFGEHLLGERPSDPVVLVESPKNACVGAAAYPQYVWVAVGNKGMLKREVLRVLQNRRVVVFPDEDAFDEWEKALSKMKDIAMFKLVHAPGEGKKRDVADWIISPPTPERGSSL